MTEQSRLALPRNSRRDVWAWTASICFAVVLHAGVAAALLLEFASGAAEAVTPPMAAMTVELANLPSAPERKVTEIPPGPEQVEQKPQPKPQLKQLQFDPPPEIKSRPPPDALAAKPEKEPTPEQRDTADHTTSAPSSLAETQDVLQAPIQGSPSDQAASATQTWENRLLTHLEHYKRYPGAAQRQRQEDVVYLRFTMDRSGNVLNWRIERSRGYALLDGEVNELIRRASPLPPPPADVSGATIEMVIPVEFFMRRGRIAQMERQ